MNASRRPHRVPAAMIVGLPLFGLVAIAALPAHAQTTGATGTVVEYINKRDFPKAPSGQYFYSATESEQLNVDVGNVGDFFRTGRTFAAGGGSPVCRFYGSQTPGPNSHFFTVDAGECNGLKAAQIVPAPTTVQQWNYEGNGFNTTTATRDASTGALSCPAGTTMVLRAYNNAFAPSGAKNAWDSNHRFVRSQADVSA